MAGPVSHIYCALAILLSGTLSIENPRDFIIGSLFPDIRYLGVIERSQTHKPHITWHDVQTASSDFDAGMKLHALVDVVREAYVVHHSLYDHFSSLLPYKSQFLKFFEDALLHNKVADWSTIIGYFDTILPEEQAFGIDDTALHLWHSLMQQYLAQQPDVSNIRTYLYTLLTQQHLAQKGSVSFWNRLLASLKSRIFGYQLTKVFYQCKKNIPLQKSIYHFYRQVVSYLPANPPASAESVA
ncbi:MAG TPA: hypothetical protein VEK38_02235 [Candidatus Bathyarchaeia archaeon]|nr:hypothetical protein [Candidatus Bathyarchaeia archaeon]